MWCRLGTLLINRDGERKPLSSSVRSKQNEKKYDYYGATGVIDKVDSYIFSEKLLLVGEDGANLLSKIKPNAFFAEGKYWVNNHAHILDATDKSLLDYVIVVINSISLDNYITGSAQPKLSQEKLNKILLPLPPLSEQRRIVEKIEELLALVDDLETNKIDLQSYIKQAKSKVLEMAIRGELVPQNPEDEPASVLLERIKKEKPSQKSKGKNTAHNTHYEEELPKNWAWCRLGEFCDIYQPKTITTKEITKSGKYKVFGANGVIGYYDKYNHDFEEVAVTCRGATCGTVNMTEAKSWITGNAMVITPLNSYLSKKYLFYYLKNSNMEDIITGSAQPQITKTKIEKLLFITPPLAEQERIVEKIEEIFSELEFIEEALI